MKLILKNVINESQLIQILYEKLKVLFKFRLIQLIFIELLFSNFRHKLSLLIHH